MNTTIQPKIHTAISCVLGSAALCTALSTCVLAEDVPSKTVRYSDLNITNAEGAKVLYTRIRAAALEVCKPATESDPFMGQAAKACIEKAIDKAVRDVDSPALTYLRFGNADVRLASK